jgi:hypothetical protein
MMGFDERETCYLEDCGHAAACHLSTWETRESDGHALLSFGACQVDGCPCNEYERNPWPEALAQPPRSAEPSAVVNRLVFLVEWSYKTLSVGDHVPGKEVDEEMSRLGKEGWEIIDRLYADGATHYRFKKPLLKGIIR